MSAKTFRTVGRRTQVAAALAGLVALFAGSAFLSAPGNQAGASSGAVSATGQAVYLGKANAKRIPLCPQRCQAMAIVSGLQAKAGGIANAYRAPFVGKITRWRIKLAAPTTSQINFFKTKFGATPQAAIGVLAKKTQNGQVVYKLRRRSQAQDLSNFFGKTATFNVPGIKVNKGDYVALIVPTWAPALSVPAACEVTSGKMKNPTVCNQFNMNNSWVASRTKKQCFNSDGSIAPITGKTSQPQMKVGTQVPYGCRFNGALTYGVRVESR